MLNKIEEKFERVFEWLNEDGDDILKMSVVFGLFIVLIGLVGLCC